MGILSPLLQNLRFREVLKYINRYSVLDVGCGKGDLAFWIDEHIRYVGIDYDRDAIYKARKRAKRKGLKNTNFYVVDLDKSPLPVFDKFDTIVMIAIIEHLNEPIRILNHLKKCFTEDTFLVITTPHPKIKRFYATFAKFGLFNINAVKEHKSLILMEELKKLILESGFEILVEKPFEFGLNQLCVARFSE